MHYFFCTGESYVKAWFEIIKGRLLPAISSHALINTYFAEVFILFLFNFPNPHEKPSEWADTRDVDNFIFSTYNVLWLEKD